MSRALVPLAQGCEELEAITITDLLVRAGVDVTTAGLDDQTVIASRGTHIIPDTNIETVKNELFDLIVLPGGLPGADHLRDDIRLQTLLQQHAQNNKLIAAICAAPRALAAAGLLEGKKITCYPGALDEYPQLDVRSTAIEIDGQIITSRGPGTAMDFALTLIELLKGLEKCTEIEHQLVR
ncbi:MAG: DJ-1/PfpI family protein [Gammaproteobacteria bacterium]|nr:DJ-1/PfpI family protein [Gammaproteobacteria bacterium]MCK5262218.1 DJ-1/PfpI family protein [Gammaproteobacteria bacterium]